MGYHYLSQLNSYRTDLLGDSEVFSDKAVVDQLKQLYA